MSVHLDFYMKISNSSYDQLVERSGKTTMLISRLKTLCIEIYKSINRINPTYMQNIVVKSRTGFLHDIQITYRFHKLTKLVLVKKSLRMLGPQIWNELPDKIKSTESLENFKKIIKLWEGPNCNCSVCRFLFTQS